MSDALRERSFSVTNDRGDPVDCDLRFLDDGNAKPAVVFCHGFKGFKDWGPFPEWGRCLAHAGFLSIHMNFSYNGVHREAPTEFTELDKFANNTFRRELDDLRAVLDAVQNGGLPAPGPDPSGIGLVGHSRGGGIVVVQAARDSRVNALVTWSSVGALVDHFTDEQIDDWETQGYTEIVNGRTGQVMRLNKVLYEDAVAHKEELHVQTAAAEISAPWLVVHARDDETVDFSAAKALIEASNSAELMVADGGHTFGGAHPAEGTVPESLEAVWDRTIAFLHSHIDT